MLEIVTRTNGELRFILIDLTKELGGQLVEIVFTWRDFDGLCGTMVTKVCDLSQ